MPLKKYHTAEQFEEALILANEKLESQGVLIENMRKTLHKLIEKRVEKSGSNSWNRLLFGEQIEAEPITDEEMETIVDEVVDEVIEQTPPDPEETPPEETPPEETPPEEKE